MFRSICFIKLLSLAVCLAGIEAIAGNASPAAEQQAARQPKPPRPNIIVILADDMGFSDAGCYGGEIETPHLDRLAAGGLRFTQFYNTGRCWPTRASLMTGLYPHQAGHAMSFGAKAPPGYQGTSRARGLMISELLGESGYRCYHVGKWHLNGRGPDAAATFPLRRGFDHSYYMRTQNNFFNPRMVQDEERLIRRPGAKGDYYATDALSDRAVENLRQHAAATSSKAGETATPFFLYLAYTAPHFPLHALPEDIARYRGKYAQGWDAVRRERLARQREMKLLDCQLSPRDEDAVAWEGLSAAEQTMWSERMALHAAMVHAIDRGVGRVIAQLKESGEIDNTLILFLSDNGASAEYLVRGDGHDPTAPAGSAATYLCLEVGWANACNTPFRFHKMWTHEGGIATPLIAHWPRGIKARGALTADIGHVIDIMPTALELAGVKYPADIDGRPAPHPPGKSLAPLFAGQERAAHEFLFWEHVGNRAIRQGDWKLVAEHRKPWELYNLKTDRSELRNLAETQPHRVEQLRGKWEKFAKQIGVVSWDSLPQSKNSPGPDYRRK